MKRAEKQEKCELETRSPAGLAGWLLARFRGTTQLPPRLALLERIALAPRQTLALIEAEGRRLLVATSPEGAPTFYALGEADLQLSHAGCASHAIPIEGYVC
jgi:hypothetical protein